MTPRDLILAARTALRKLWWWLRQVSGDAAYENYLRCVRAARGAATGKALSGALLTQEQFYLDVLRRRFDSVHRCC